MEKRSVNVVVEFYAWFKFNFPNFFGIVICDNYRAWNKKQEDLNQGKIQQKHK